ncbi:MAG: type VII toxin-antitoxin system MntA family adenylyltransferase antitoxin [Candidatus Aenigmatarchaeota archaeon]
MKQIDIEDPAVEKVRRKVEDDRGASALLLFGSRARGTESEGSDIDLCVVLNPDLKKDEVFDKTLEYLSLETEKIDISIFQNLPVVVKKKIFEEGDIVFSKDIDLVYDLAFQTIKEYDDFRKYYEDYLEGVKNA